MANFFTTKITPHIGEGTHKVIVESVLPIAQTKTGKAFLPIVVKEPSTNRTLQINGFETTIVFWIDQIQQQVAFDEDFTPVAFFKKLRDDKTELIFTAALSDEVTDANGNTRRYMNYRFSE